jgi:hypothetical protein
VHASVISSENGAATVSIEDASGVADLKRIDGTC